MGNAFRDSSLLLIVGLLIFEFHVVTGVLRYTEQSCIDLTPKKYDSMYDFRKRRSERHDIPYKITAIGKRYSRDSDVVVQLNGSTFDSMMLQARTMNINGNYQSLSTTSGRIGVVGQFLDLNFPFKYLSCFDSPASTIIDDGNPFSLQNVSFIWRAPDQDVGNIRFIASILKAVRYWVIVSNTLTFNPFPISSYSCGSTLGCFRICQYDHYTCLPKDAVFVFTYHVDTEQKQIEFTIGGRLEYNNSYLAVAFGEEYEDLRRADMTACWMHRGKAKVEHLLIENLSLPPYLEQEQSTEVDDYDVSVNEQGERQLWCRFKKPLNHPKKPHFDIHKPLYHFHFWGTVDCFSQRFILPENRDDIYTSAYKRNFSEPVNEIASKCSKISSTRMSMSLIYAPIVVAQISDSQIWKLSH